MTVFSKAARHTSPAFRMTAAGVFAVAGFAFEARNAFAQTSREPTPADPQGAPVPRSNNGEEKSVLVPRGSLPAPVPEKPAPKPKITIAIHGKDSTPDAKSAASPMPEAAPVQSDPGAAAPVTADDRQALIGELFKMSFRQPQPGEKAAAINTDAYHDMMHDFLKQFSTDELQSLKDHKVALCMDERFLAIENGHTVDLVFYNSRSPVLAINIALLERPGMHPCIATSVKELLRVLDGKAPVPYLMFADIYSNQGSQYVTCWKAPHIRGYPVRDAQRDDLFGNHAGLENPPVFPALICN